MKYTCEHSGITFERNTEYETAYFNAMNAVLAKALEIGKQNTFELDGRSGISHIISFLTDIVAKRPK